MYLIPGLVEISRSRSRTIFTTVENAHELGVPLPLWFRHLYIVVVLVFFRFQNFAPGAPRTRVKTFASNCFRTESSSRAASERFTVFPRGIVHVDSLSLDTRPRSKFLTKILLYFQ